MAVVELIREMEAARLIVGLPLLPSGDRGEQAAAVEAFVASLRPLLAIPIEMWDESYSTLGAEARMAERGTDRARSRTGIDAEAAAVILEEWMREHAGGGSAGSEDMA